jgi:hypothetical protein
MSGADDYDLSGHWAGIFNYPAEFPPNGFEAEVRDSFVKIYDDLERPTVHYRGTIQPGGDEIEGIWTIPGDWSGTFMMVRARKEKAAEERKIDVDVPVAR